MKPETSFEHCKLLIADDAYYARFLIKKYLAPLKFGQIYEAENGQEVIDLYPRVKPDLVLMDIIMRELNGLRTLEALMGLFPDARVIIISAIDMPDVLHECIELGIVDFLTKPFLQEEIIKAVSNALRPEKIA